MNPLGVSPSAHRELPTSDRRAHHDVKSLFNVDRAQAFSATFRKVARRTQRLIRAIYDLQEENGYLLSRMRNEAILKNVKSALDNIQGERILVVFGLDHKYFLDEMIEGTLVLESFLNPKDFESYVIPKSLKSLAIRNIRSAEILLAERLKQGFYAGEMVSRLGKKLETFPRWLEALSQLA